MVLSQTHDLHMISISFCGYNLLTGLTMSVLKLSLVPSGGEVHVLSLP